MKTIITAVALFLLVLFGGSYLNEYISMALPYHWLGIPCRITYTIGVVISATLAIVSVIAYLEGSSHETRRNKSKNSRENQEH